MCHCHYYWNYEYLALSNRIRASRLWKVYALNRCIHYSASIRFNRKHYQGYKFNFCTKSPPSVEKPKSDRKLFEMKILDLLQSEYEEREFTDRKLPDNILNELTKDFARPKLPRISKQELYTVLQSHTSSLMPFANLLQHWTVDDDAGLQQQLKQSYKDVNYVEIGGNNESETIHSPLNDIELMDIMDEQYLQQYKDNDIEINKLYETAMLFYDISNASLTSAINIHNRLASIFLILASNLNHIEAQC